MRSEYPDYDHEANAPSLDWTGLGVLVGLEKPVPQSDQEETESEKHSTAIKNLPGTWDDCRLWFAAKIAQEIRDAVSTELGYAPCVLIDPVVH